MKLKELFQITRKAILIASPADRDGNIDDGANADVTRYIEFLRSPLGGGWRGDEIIPLKSPTRAELEEAKEKARDHDYVFILFSGHGGEEVGGTSTQILIHPDEELYSTSALLHLGNKQTLILDCCRSWLPATAKLTQTFIFLTESERAETSARSTFDEAVHDAKAGQVVLHACSQGEWAHAYKHKGALYLLELLNAAQMFAQKAPRARTTKPYVATVAEIHDLAAVKVQERAEAPQTAVITPSPVAEPSFPFAVASPGIS